MYYSFKLSFSSSFIVLSAGSNLSTNVCNSISKSRIDDGCDALFVYLCRHVNERLSFLYYSFSSYYELFYSFNQKSTNFVA